MMIILAYLRINPNTVMKRKILFTVQIAVILSVMASGQDNLYFNRSLQEFASRMQLSGSESGHKFSSVSKSTVEGSVYMNDNFEKGEIFTTSNDRFIDIPMRFNAFHSEIEVLMPDSTVWSLTNVSNISKVVLNSSAMLYTTFLADDGEKKGYLSIIYSGKHSLYRRDYKIFMEGVPSNGIVNEIPSKIVSRPKEYYLQIDSGMPKYFKNSKDLTSLLLNHKNEVDSFIKKEKINFKKEPDLIKLISYFNTLK